MLTVKNTAHFLSPRRLWCAHWQLLAYRKLFFIGIIIVATILFILPYFFEAIEKRNGIVLNDLLLDRLPARDVSIFIFVLLIGTELLLAIRSIQDPAIFITFLWSYILINLVRLITIGLIPLDAPVGLIPLEDPIITPFFYGGRFITKDLFFSGHVAVEFLIFLCLTKKNDKIWTLCATIAMTILLLIQHVHYTLDVLVAPIFSYLLWIIAKKMVNQGLKLSLKLDDN